MHVTDSVTTLRGLAVKKNIGATSQCEHISSIAFNWFCSAASEPLVELSDLNAPA